MSAEVFLPHNLAIDNLAVICAHSGYIHSCGPSLLNRNIAKASKEEMSRALTAYIDSHPQIRPPARFVVYAHEEFTHSDRYLARDLRDGLDDVKVYMDKYYVGSESLVSVLKEMRNSKPFTERLTFPERDHYAKSLKIDSVAMAKADPVSTIWLIVDHKPSDNIRHRGDKQYFILYHQQYLNDSPLHLFDENKPAWLDHTTIPHTLVSAMINITRPWWPEDQEVHIGDPFVGTGTTLIEAAKYRATPVCRDKEAIAGQLVADNVRFFCSTSDEIRQLSEDIGEASAVDPTERLVPLTPLKRYGSKENPPVKQDYFTALSIFDRVCPDPHRRDANITTRLYRELRKAGHRVRILFYIALRTHRRNLEALERDGVDWKKAFEGEAGELIDQMKRLVDIKVRQEYGHAVEDEGVLVFPGKYSESCSVLPASYDVLRRSVEDPAKLVRRAEVVAFPERSCDVIITDPPYGLNSEMSREQLATLYQEMLVVLIRALKDEGHLVFALPDWSHIGRQVPFFATKQFVTQQVLAVAEKQGKDIVEPAYTVPSPGYAFRPPYYWESDRALRRAILHFRLRKVYKREHPREGGVEG